MVLDAGLGLESGTGLNPAGRMVDVVGPL